MFLLTNINNNVILKFVGNDPVIVISQQAETVVFQALETPDGDGNSGNGPNVLDKERNLMNEDPKWQGQSKLYLPW